MKLMNKISKIIAAVLSVGCFLTACSTPGYETVEVYTYEEAVAELESKLTRVTCKTAEPILDIYDDVSSEGTMLADINTYPYKSSGGEMIYNETLKCEIPKGWKVRELGTILVEARKSAMQVNDAKNKAGEFPFFTSGDEIVDYNEYYVDGFNLFLNTGGNADVKSYFGKAAYSTDAWCISANEFSFMLDIFLKSIKTYLNDSCFAGSGLKHLQKNIFKQLKMIAPDETILEEFNNIVCGHFEIISHLQVENKKLASLRDWLLPMLMNGQVKIIN